MEEKQKFWTKFRILNSKMDMERQIRKKFLEKFDKKAEWEEIEHKVVRGEHKVVRGEMEKLLKDLN
jgi:hypothetical protein